MSDPRDLPDDNGATMVYHELHAVVKRYMDEAPEMTVFQLGRWKRLKPM